MGEPKVIFGISPLGGNAVEGADATKPDEDTTTRTGVPLFYDSRVDAFISEQAIQELDDIEIGEELALRSQEEAEFRAKAGFQ